MPSKPVLDRGETLVELLVAVTILGMTVLAAVGGLTTSIMASDRHQKLAMASLQVRAFAEAIQGFVVNNSGYLECAPTDANGRVPHYQIYTPPSGFTAVVTGIAYWNPAAPYTPAPLPTAGPSPAPATAGTFGGTCQNGGVQRLSLTVTVNGSNVTEQMDIYVRQPCRPGDPPCA
jgi:type II secretory pathway pseudopilin PulG